MSVNKPARQRQQGTELAIPMFEQFEISHALSLGIHLLSMAEERQLVIAIGVNLGDQVIFRASLPGTNSDYQHWIERKFATVRRFNRSSFSLERQMRDQPEFSRERALDEASYALVGGAVPVLIGSTQVGIVGVAGLASADDHALVMEALATFPKSA